MASEALTLDRDLNERIDGPRGFDPSNHTGDEPAEPNISFGPMTRARVLAMALPIIGENLLHTSVLAVDTLMVAQLDKESVAGVGMAAELVFFIISILIALEVGATVLISQAFGARDLNAARRLARQAIVWGIIIAIPVSIGGYVLSDPVIALFGAEPAVADHAATYLEITAATSIVMLLTFVGGAVFRGVGDSRTPLFASIAANAVNLIVAYLLIFGQFGLPELGVAGSAWGAAIGRGTAAVVLLALLIRGRRAISIRGRAGWLPSLSTGRDLFRLGFPASLEQALSSFGFMAMLAVVALLGTASLAAQQIGFTALSIAFMPGFGFALAATALVGQSVGARRLDAAAAAARIACLWAVVWMAVGGLLYFALADPVMRVFTDDAEVIAAGVNALRALSLSLPFWAVWSVGGGSLRGLGDTRTPLVMSVVTIWLAVGLAYGAVKWLDGGLGTVWLTFMLTSPLGAFGNWTVLQRRLRRVRAAAAAGEPLGFVAVSH